ncbi:DNA replication protein [Glugoides intestinalis]
MDYYNIDLILAQEEKIMVKLPRDVENFGFYLSPEHLTIKKDTNVELPFFLVKFLLQHEYCNITAHPVENRKNDLDANASLVNLNNEHFYGLGKFLFDQEYLSKIFLERIGAFMTFLPKEDFSQDDLTKQSYEERKLILRARKVFVEFQNFYFGKESNLFEF